MNIHPLYKKLGGIGFIAALLFIPQAQVESLIEERMQRYEEANRSLAEEWGTELSIAGPFFEIPCKGPLGGKQKDGTQWLSSSYIAYAKTLSVDAHADVLQRSRGIFRVNVFRAHADFAGEVSPGNPPQDGSSCDSARAVIYVRGRQSSSTVAILEADGKSEGMTLDKEEDGTARFSAPVALNGKKNAWPFKISVSADAGKILRIRPYAQSATMHIASNWETPSFLGPIRPSRIDNDPGKGFLANWVGTPSTRGAAGSALLFDWDGAESGSLGVEFLPAVSHYQQVTRTIKYAALFIVLTFGTMFLFEVINKIRIHPVQYASVGIALCVFYLLLLSLSEEIAFSLAYPLAALGVVTIITGYARSVLGARARAGIIGGGLSGLYGFLYFLVSAERYSLLFGSLAVFLLVAAFMYVTRDVDWYRVGIKPVEVPQ